jgi:hypothetical protein
MGNTKMKSFIYSVLSISFAFFLMVESVIAQTYFFRPNDSTTTKSETRIGLGYSSDYYFMGRADSAKAPYLSPSVGYYHHSGVFARGSFSYLTAPGAGRVDLITFSVGYEYFENNFAGGISGSAYFFSEESYAIPSEISTYLYGYGGYDFSFLMLYIDASLGFSEYTDLFLGAEINRTFYFFRNRLRIIPALYMNAGSQHYYNEYYTNRSNQTGSGKGNGKGGNQQPAPSGNPEIQESEKFQLLDYEAELIVVYKIKNIRLYVGGTWTFPVNPSTVTTDQGTYEETLTNGFYWYSGIRFSLFKD